MWTLFHSPMNMDEAFGAFAVFAMAEECQFLIIWGSLMAVFNYIYEQPNIFVFGDRGLGEVGGCRSSARRTHRN